MPILEFYSPDTHKIYAFYARNREQSSRIPPCPDNPSYSMERILSPFSVTGLHRKAETLDDGAPAADDPRLMAAMSEMERAMANMDENNPDPRQMGSILRRMAEISGEPLNGGLEEMIRRLEAGESPEALEEELGSLMDEGDGDLPGEAEDSSSGSDGGALKSIARRVRRRKEPARDPQLYDFPPLP
jgi:hypothetical protein